MACGPKTPLVLNDNTPVNLDNCNEKDHLWFKGIGQTAQDAINSAHKGIANQIRSEISTGTSTKVDYKSSDQQGKVQTTRTDYYSGNINIRSNFSHNELIKDVIQPTKVGDEYRALACLNKSEAQKVLTGEIKGTVMAFNRLVDAAQNKHNSGDIAGFSAHYHQALALTDEIEAVFRTIRSITGNGTRMQSTYNQSIDSLQKIMST